MSSPAEHVESPPAVARTPATPLRFVTAASLFDGHDASINIMRRVLQSEGVEVIHLGHDRGVLEIVEAMSDATPAAGEQKPPWRARKEAYVAHLAGCDDPGVHRVCMADKLYNLRAINDDLAEIGDQLWERFSAPPEDQLWYFTALGEAFAAGPLGGSRARRAYGAELARLEGALS